MRIGFFLGTLKLDFQNIPSESYTTDIGLITFCINLVLFIYEQTEYSVYRPFRDQLCKSGFKVQTNSFQLTFYHKNNYGHWFIFRGLTTCKRKKGCFEIHFCRPLPTINRLTSFKNNINKGQPYIDNETQLNDTETAEF